MTRGVVAYKITDDVINEVRIEAKKATGKDKLMKYKKLRFLINHKGKYLIKIE